MLFPENPRFERRRVLGEGGFGVVYEAFDREWGVPIALKVLREREDHRVVRFKREFRSLADVRHPNLLRIHRLYVEPSCVYFTTDLVDGVDLGTALRPKARARSRQAETAPEIRQSFEPDRPFALLDAQQLRRFGKLLVQLAEGLQHLHRAGWIHRDVKPSNILVTRDDRVVLVDFGLVEPTEPMHATARDAWTGMVPGTPGYVSPEQLATDALDTASDAWSVGVVMAELLVGGATRDDVARARATTADDVLTSLLEAAMALLDPDPNSRAGLAHLLDTLAHIDGVVTGLPSACSDGQIPFVGRHAERAAIAGAFAALDRGEAAWVRVRGDAGVGKSALVAQAIAEASAVPNRWIFGATCRDRELVPFRGVDALMDQLGAAIRKETRIRDEVVAVRDLHLVGEIFPALALAEGPPRDARGLDTRRQAFAAWRDLLAAVAIHRRLVLVIDDAHWGDADSGILLSFLAERPAPVLVLVLQRTEGETSPLMTTLGDALARHGRTWIDIDLAALTADESRALVAELVDEEAGRDQSRIERTIAAAAGMPLFLVTLTTSGEAAIDVDFERWTTRRVSALPPEATAILETTSLAAIPLEEDVLLAAVGDMAGARPALIELDVARLLRRTPSGAGSVFEPFHDRIRQAIARRVDVTTAQRHHRALAAAFIARYGDRARPEVLFVHFRGAGEDEEASIHGERAARKAQHALAFDRASSLYAEAARLTKVRDREHQLLELAGDSLLGGGRTKDAAIIFDELARRPAVAAATSLRRKAAEAYLVTGHHEEGLRIWREIARGMGMRFPASPVAATVASVAAVTRARFPWLPRLAPVDRVEAAARAEAALAAAKGLIATNPMHGVFFGVSSLGHARESASTEGLVTSLSFVSAACLAAAGGVWRRWAIALLDEAESHARASGVSYLRANVTIMRAQIALFQGRWRDAAEQGRVGLEILASTGHARAWEASMARLARVRSLEELGAFAALVGETEEWRRLSEESGDVYGLVTSHLTLGIAALATGSTEEAEAHAREAVARWRGGGYSVQRFYADRIHVLAKLQRGETARAEHELARVSRAVRTSMIFRIPTGRVDTLWMESRVALGALARGPRAELITLLRKNARALDAEDHPPARAHAAFVRAQLAARGDDRAGARRQADVARCSYADADMQPMVQLLDAIEGDDRTASAIAALRDLGVVDPVAWARGHGVHVRAPCAQTKSPRVSEATR